jgi:ankyrin repeat protein
MGADVTQLDRYGHTPLIFATMKDDLAMAQCLVVELGADVNKGDDVNDGRTPLMSAAGDGHLAMVRCLIKLGARIGAVDNCS